MWTPAAPRVKLLALDLDGTLLRPDRTPDPAGAEMVRKAQSKGTVIALASGRMPASVARIRDLIGVEAAIVGLNGAIVRTSTDEVVHARYLGDGAVQTILDDAYATGVHVSLYDDERVLYAHDSEWGRRYAARVQAVIPQILPETELRAGRYHKLLFADEAHRIAEHRARVGARLDPADVNLTESEAEYLEFLPAGTDKGFGLAALAAHLGIEREDVAAVGDYLNDLEMLGFAGVSGAMANGHPAVRAAAGVVVPSNSEGGVAEFISRYVLQP